MTLSARPDASEQEIDNQRNLRRLVLSVQASLHRLNLLIAICDNPRYRNELIHTYETELTAKSITCYQVSLDRQQPSLKQTLLDWQAAHLNWQHETPTLMTVRGGDELLAIPLQQPKSAREKFFFSLQWTRESLREFQFPIILWVTQAVAQGLAQDAPDFWSWRGGVFEFVQPIAWRISDPLVSQSIEPIAPSTPIADPAELEQQIADLQAQDPNSPLLASLYQSLGIAYDERLEQGIAVNRREETEKAIAALNTAIALDESAPDPTSLATSLSYLADLYRSMGRYSEAEPLVVQSLAIKEAQLGPDHPSTATSLNNLAALYESMGRYAEAEPLYVRSLAIREAQLGPEHPDTARSLNNLAELYRSMGRYGEAEPLYVRSLAIKESQLGPDHPSTSTSLNNLALLYESMGRYGEVEPLLVRSLAIKESQLGPDHPDTATSLNNLALLYESMGRYGEAEPLLVRSLAIREAQLGSQHPYTAKSLNNLAALYESMGCYSESEPLYARSLAIIEVQLGPDHPDRADSLLNLAVLRTKQNRYTEAKVLLESALDIYHQKLGDDHPRTISAQSWLNRVQQALGAEGGGVRG